MIKTKTIFSHKTNILNVKIRMKVKIGSEKLSNILNKAQIFLLKRHKKRTILKITPEHLLPPNSYLNYHLILNQNMILF